MFFIAAAIYNTGSVIYWFTGSAKPQRWGRFETEKSEKTEIFCTSQGYVIESEVKDSIKE